MLLICKQKLERSVADGFTKEKMMKMERRAIEMEEALEAVKLEQEIQMERTRVQVFTIVIQQLQVHLIQCLSNVLGSLASQSLRSFGDDSQIL